jgi:cytochrome c-type biogenesis protein CcsB
MKKFFSKIFSMPLMVLFLLFFFIAIGAATGVEAWYGTPVAQKWVFQSNWFTFILIYLSISLIHNIIKFNLFRWKKMSSLLFHLAFLVIVIGAALTRFLGFEGVMHIREGEASNEIVSQKTYLQIVAHNNEIQYKADVPITIDTNSIAYIYPGIKGGNPFNWLANLLFDHNNYFEHAFDFGDKHFKISCQDIIYNPRDTLLVDSKGDPYLEIVTNGMNYQFLKGGDMRLFESGLMMAFNTDQYPNAINITETDSGLFVQSPYEMNWFQMSDSTDGNIAVDSMHSFIQKRLYWVGEEQFMFNRYYKRAKVETFESKGNNNGLLAITIKIEDGSDEKIVVLKGGKGQEARPVHLEFGGLNFRLGYGSVIREVPFELYLQDFRLERYPGTTNPSSFASDVILIDQKEGIREERKIFMNNVLDYGGYRFFQSSYDPDEGGTILSVNKDKPGTIMTYFGYLFLALGFFINLFSKNSRFRMLMKKSSELRIKREVTVTIILLFGLALNGFAQDKNEIEELPTVSVEHADKFAHLIVQDQSGRFQPVHTIAEDILKKVSRQTTYKGQNATQVYIGLNALPFAWLQEPLIFVSGKPLRKKFNVEGSRAAVLDFFSPSFEYLLFDDAEKARLKRPADRNEYDKDVLKTDERFNVLNGVFNGFYFRVFPKPNDSTNTWYSPYSIQGWEKNDSILVAGIMKLYVGGISEAIQSGDWEKADKVIELIDSYQQKTTPSEILPSDSKINLEIWYNKAGIFKRLMYAYMTVGFILLVLNFIQMFRTKMSLKWPNRVGGWLFGIMWLVHGGGLGLRWHLSGHAPWSNGYEAVVFISFITVLAGLLFSKNSKIVIGATGILAWLMLFVAHMNQLDPEITNLVPVLKSYWLMIHVAIITGSYGFLGLGAILAIITLFMNLFLTRENRTRVLMTSKEITYIAEMTIIAGLFMLTIGTFLGGVWANESWGRYWGWDAKETWALASVVTYVIILHFRFIPFLKSQFAFNVVSLWAYSSIIMTFFGVNFYLSGLHSYAQGDPMPIPGWVPIAVSLIFILCVFSGIKWSIAKKWAKEKSSENAIEDIV